MAKTKRPLDLDGVKFGRLTATNVMIRRADGRLLRFCKCECGKPVEVPTGRLTSGHTKSCGCLRVDVRRLNPGVAPRNEVLDNYIRGAAKRKLSWKISEELFDGLLRQRCWYCSLPPSTIRKGRRGNGDFTYNGIDRVDNTVGYEPGNCVSCCEKCNRMKMSMKYREFLEHIDRISKNMRGWK